MSRTQWQLKSRSVSPFWITIACVVGSCQGRVSQTDGGGQPVEEACQGEAPGTERHRVRYAAESVAYGEECLSETQTQICQNGVWGPWSGTYRFDGCVVRSSVDCGSIPDGGSEVRNCYHAASVPSGSTCTFTVQTRECKGGVFNPDWPACAHTSCAVLEWLISPTPMVKLTQPGQALPAEMGTVLNVFDGITTTVTKRISDSMPEYPTSQMWNADMSLLRLNRGVVLDGATFQATNYSLAGCGGDHRTWSSIDPDYCYGSGEGGQWVKKNVRTNTIYYSTASGWVTTSTSRSYAPFGTNYVFALNGEGESIDNGDRAAALVGNDGTAIQVIDPKTGNPRCSVTGMSGIDNARVSRDGAYVMTESSSGIDAFTITDSGSCPFHRKLSNTTRGHWDACVDINGDNAIVIENGEMVRVADGHVSTVWAASPSTPRQTHVSCTNRTRPGFAYFGDQSDDSRVVDSDFYNRCWAVKLDPAATYVAGVTEVENWLWQHHRVPAVATPGDAPHCTASPDGRIVIFAARWDGTDSAVRSYVSYVP